MPFTSLGSYLRFWPIGHKSEILTTTSLGLINWLEQLIELRKQVYSLDYRLIPKDTEEYESPARWRDACGEAPNKGASLLVESEAQQGGTWKHFGLATWKLFPVPLGVYGSFVTKVWLIKSLAIGNWFNLQPLSPPGRSGVGLKVPSL